ncbi:MAG: hydrogenase formation protein HypD [Moorea sp. SIO3G5]|nr:hydrogenase formation protein HypD [Moorena sp. SIO3G5]
MTELVESLQSKPTQTILQDIKRLSSSLTPKPRRPVKLMAVSGEQTLAIARHNLNGIALEHLEFVQGYGKAAWSLPIDRVNHALAIAQKPDVILTTFSEVMTIRGSQQNLSEIRGTGADIRTINSPQDALKIAQENPSKQVVFFAVGYEDSVLSTAQTVGQAAAEGISNFSVYCNHMTLIPAIKAILDSPSIHIDGLICASEVASVIGLEPYRFFVESYRKPIIIADSSHQAILKATQTLLQQLVDGHAELKDQAQVPAEGNSEALQTICQVFEPREFYEWRGMGSVDFSGLRLRSEYVQFDAEVKFNLPKLKLADVQFAQCMTILTGVFQPCQCKIFGAGCSPKTPMGTYMTTEEGICAMHYKVFPFIAAISD